VQDGDEDCGEKKAHRGRIDWSPGKCFALPQIKTSLLVILPPSLHRRESQAKLLFECFPTCNFFLEYDPRFSVAPFQMKLNGLTRPATFTFLT